MTASRPGGAVDRFFAATLAEGDPDVASAIGRERTRQQDQIELIASENTVARAALEAGITQRTQILCRRFPVYP